MKKIILSVIVAISATSMSAQTVNVHFKNGQQIQFSSNNVDYVDFSEKAPDPTVTAGAVVDLGLSVYWCSCNVGAEAPEEYGDYFAWGETKSKSSYNQANYSYYDSNKAQYMDIGDNISGTAYDAATVNLGNDWKMPTKEQLQELIDKCTWEWTQINGINGYKVTGANGNSIFLPAGEYNKRSQAGSMIYYDSGTKSDLQYRTQLFGNSMNYHMSTSPKYHGFTIRPITTNPNAGGGPGDHSNDHLVTEKISTSFSGGSISSINGRIQTGSVLNVKFINASDQSVTLINAEIHDSGKAVGNNFLSEEIEVPAGESKSYSVTLGSSMTTPVICFTYRYNRKKYTVEATYSAN